MADINAERKRCGLNLPCVVKMNGGFWLIIQEEVIQIREAFGIVLTAIVAYSNLLNVNLMKGVSDVMSVINHLMGLKRNLLSGNSTVLLNKIIQSSAA